MAIDYRNTKLIDILGQRQDVKGLIIKAIVH